jgi:hypothetical protein
MLRVLMIVQYEPPKRRSVSTRLHSATSQKAAIFSVFEFLYRSTEVLKGVVRNAYININFAMLRHILHMVSYHFVL